MKQQFWLGVVSKEHVLRGQAGNFAQVCHGKAAPLARMQAQDLLVYYSPNAIYGDKTPYQCFTAIGIIQTGLAYQVKMAEDFAPYRRDVQYLATQDTAIRPLITKLSFIRDPKKWGAAFRFGILKIPRADFIIIATAMELTNEQINAVLI